MIDSIILADDLTGACDTGIKLKKLGYRTKVIVDIETYNNFSTCDGLALSINTNTRSNHPQTAYFMTSQSIKKLKDIEVGVYYKKIDSVFRGNVGCEIEACLDILPLKFALIAPALPGNGRRIINGRLIVQNSEGPIWMVDAADTIGKTTNRKVAVITIEEIRKGAEILVERISSLVSDGYELILLDTIDDNDFIPITEAAKHFSGNCLYVGSAGWIPHLFPEKPAREEPANEWRSAAVTNHVLVVVGTRHPVTVAQMMKLRDNPMFSVYLLPTDNIDTDVYESCVKKVTDQFDAELDQLNVKQGIIITTDAVYQGNALEETCTSNVANKTIVTALAHIVEHITQKIAVDAIIMSGGDVSGGIMKQMRLDSIDLLEEPFEGIATGVAEKENKDPLLIITKSGGFGSENTLEQLYNYICNTRF